MLNLFFTQLAAAAEKQAIDNFCSGLAAAADMHFKQHGQYFTQDREIKFMIDLIENTGGSILEPSAGNGAFLRHLSGNVTSVELDKNVARPESIVMDFFEYSENNKFDVIIGNPPYVANSLILGDTKQLLKKYETWSEKTNLFVLFMEKCLNHLGDGGELIFIVPSVFFQATSALKLNQRMHREGSITHFVDFGDTSPFAGAAPEGGTCIFRYVKKSSVGEVKYYELQDKKITYICNKWHHVNPSGYAYIMDTPSLGDNLTRIGEYFQVKVGAVSGKDDFFRNEEYATREFVCSKTRQTGELRGMIYVDHMTDHPSEWKEDLEEVGQHLVQHEKLLRARAIKKEWKDHDWWKWGRGLKELGGKRVYVNNKTRTDNPFFHSECDYYDGSVLGIYFKDQDMEIERVVDMLNRLDWSKVGMKIGGRFIFKQRALENLEIPKEMVDSCYEPTR
tara:strand:+ start:622 stop:1968 length:1347 start_codon:yes stop_codon:yes gene_type:complete